MPAQPEGRRSGAVVRAAARLLEGHILPGDEALEGPFGDHTGYYNNQGRFPLLTAERLSVRRQGFYHGGHMGRSPWDGPSVLAMPLNEMFVPLLQRRFPEIVDFDLPRSLSVPCRRGQHPQGLSGPSAPDHAGRLVEPASVPLY